MAALASWLDARASAGRWLLRIEDVDTPRTVPGAAECIMAQLRALGLDWDGEIMWQSRRGDAYQAAFDALAARGLIYGCGCTRREIADSALRGQTAPGADGERPYPGTCRHGLPPGREARAWRLRMPDGVERFEDRWLGPQEQDVARAVGDIALRRADGLWAYQLAVVVDDAAQGVTDVVRGADLLSSTARQRMLGRLLDLPLPRHARAADPGRRQRPETVQAERRAGHRHERSAGRATGRLARAGLRDPRRRGRPGGFPGAGHGAMGAPLSASGRLSVRGPLYSGCKSAPSIRTSSASPFSPTRSSPNRATS